MKPTRTQLVEGGIASLAVVGLLAGAQAWRRAARRRSPDPYAEQDFRAIYGDRASTHVTSDGVKLAVRERGPAAAGLTLIFAHGFCNTMASFHFQRMGLVRRWGDDARLVFFDQRGHGESGPAPAGCTIRRLGEDLAGIIGEYAGAAGPVIVVGHSMGGMGLLAAVQCRPALFAERVSGVALLSTSATSPLRAGLGRLLHHPALAFGVAVRTVPALVRVGRKVSRPVSSPIMQAISYRSRVSPALARFTTAMIENTSAETIVAFHKAITAHDESAALPLLADTPALVLSGSHDQIMPPAHSRALAAALPSAELVSLPGAGHLAHLEFPEAADDAIDELITRATGLTPNEQP